MPNVAKFSRALVALHQVGLLKDDACREPITLFIRQATEGRHWHRTAHYRSRAAADLINQSAIASPAEYHRFCVRNLRHEHIVPNAAIYRLIRAEPNVTVEYLESLLRRFGLRATITRDEDTRLSRDKMPSEFFQSGHQLFMNPFARYIVAGLFDSLERRTSESWFEG